MQKCKACLPRQTFQTISERHYLWYNSYQMLSETVTKGIPANTEQNRVRRTFFLFLEISECFCFPVA